MSENRIYVMEAEDVLARCGIALAPADTAAVDIELEAAAHGSSPKEMTTLSIGQASPDDALTACAAKLCRDHLGQIP